MHGQLQQQTTVAQRAAMHGQSQQTTAAQHTGTPPRLWTANYSSPVK